MDPQKFGAFIASVRKEKHMTQSDLAEKLRVTDKAVSRWERGLGFPDIHSFEPLANALEVSVLELIRSEKDPQVTREVASAALVDTMNVAKQQRRSRIKKLSAAAAGILLAICLFLVGTGLMTRTDVFLHEYSLLPSGDVMTVRVGVAGSMGYIRSCTDVSEEPGKIQLKFYSAFGGLNSDFGARNVFLIPLPDGCTEIHFIRGDGPHPVLIRDEVSGQWKRPE